MRNVIVAILVLLLSMTTSVAAEEFSFMLIVSAQNPQNQISMSELNRIFLGKTRKWAHGESIALSINTNEAAMEAFCRTIVKKTPRQFSMYWRKQLYSGHSMLPAQLNGDEPVIDYVCSRSGAVGVILTSTNDPRIKEMVITP